MPPKAVQTIRELIYWTYAEQVIAPSAGFAKNYRFIMSRYEKLKKGEMNWSSIQMDLKQEELGKYDEKCCAYCGSVGDLSHEHLIPLHRHGPDLAENRVLACRSCNSSKRDKDIFEWYGVARKEEVPGHVLSKYLKLVYKYHEELGTLDQNDLNRDGELNVRDLGEIFKVKNSIPKEPTP